MVLRIVVGRLLSHRIRRIADDDLYGRSSLLLRPVRIFGQLREGATELSTLAKLECVRKADAGEGLVAALLSASRMVSVLNINGRNVVGEQDDFVCVQLPLVLAWQGVGIYQPALYHADNECARTGKRVKNVHVLIRQRAPKSCLQEIGHALVDEIHHLHGRVHDTQTFYSEREGRPEKLVVELKDGPLPFSRCGEICHTEFDGLVEAGENSCILLEGLFFQQVDHLLQSLRDRIALHKGVVFEQGLEDRFGDHVLGKHLDELVSVHRRIDVLAQVSQHLVEGLLVRAICGYQFAYPCNVQLGNLGDILRPLLQVALVANLLHHAGIDGFLQALEIGQLQLRQSLARTVATTRAFSSAYSANDNPVASRLVHVEPVDDSLEAVVVRTQGVENSPDNLVALVVVQGFFRLDGRRHEDRNDDVAKLLAGCRAHDTPHGLYHIYLRVSGREKQNRIQRRYVHAFGQAAGIGEDAALVAFGRRSVQPGQFFIANRCRHGAIDMLGRNIDNLGTFIIRQAAIVVVLEAVEDAGNVL